MVLRWVCWTEYLDKTYLSSLSPIDNYESTTVQLAQLGNSKTTKLITVYKPVTHFSIIV